VKFNKERRVVRVMRGTSETGIFRKGQNAYVDKIVFGEGEFEPMKSFPYTNVIGRTIKKPECLGDVSSEVLEDYQNYLEQQWVSQLRSKYSFTINKKVLNDIHCE
jgi:peptidyl-prolyl cis-trans isomerase SurA